MTLENSGRDFGAYMTAASQIYLAGCSTADQAQQVNHNKGFQAATLGTNVANRYQHAVVWATEGTLYLNTASQTLSVAGPRWNPGDQVWTKVARST